MASATVESGFGWAVSSNPHSLLPSQLLIDFFLLGTEPCFSLCKPLKLSSGEPLLPLKINYQSNYNLEVY
jgi:hypothetical protein